MSKKCAVKITPPKNGRKKRIIKSIFIFQKICRAGIRVKEECGGKESSAELSSNGKLIK